MPTNGSAQHADVPACSSTDVLPAAEDKSDSRERQHQPCGTPAAARRHHKRGEPLDEACREAFRRYHREYRRAARRVDTFRRRELQARARWEKRINADPARREQRRRQQRAAARAREAAAGPVIDAIAIERATAGDRSVRLTREEKAVALQQLLDRGFPVTAAGARLGMSGTTVRRYVGRGRHDPRVEVAS